MAQRPLQRRLRQIASGVEWTDVIAAVLAERLLDALGGDEVAAHVLWHLVTLLGIDT